MVAKDGACAATAMKLAAGKVDGGRMAFEGTLRLADGTEPYTVRVMTRAGETGKPPEMWVIGDTGGDMRMMRRTFPFEAHLSRQGEATCKAEHKTS